MFDRMLLVLDESADRARVVAALRPLARVEHAHIIVLLTIPFLETVAEMPHELSSDLAGDGEASDVFVAALVASLRAEGLSADGSHPLQKAWNELDVPQCGYCQAGQIMTAAALLASKPTPSDADIDGAMTGNLCRCATYLRIREAIHKAAGPAAVAKPTK